MIDMKLQFFGGRGGSSGMSGSSSSSSTVAAQSRKLDKTPFTNEGGGQWTLDTNIGGASILDESDTAAGGYGAMRAYSMKAWDANYNEIGESQIFGSLNAAKAAAKKAIKSTL